MEGAPHWWQMRLDTRHQDPRVPHTEGGHGSHGRSAPKIGSRASPTWSNDEVAESFGFVAVQPRRHRIGITGMKESG